MPNQLKAFYKRYTQANPKQAFLIFQALLAGSLIFLLGLWRLYNNQPMHFAFDTSLSLVFFVFGYIGSYERFYTPMSRLFAITYTVAIWTVIQFLGVVGLYWSLVAIVATHFVARSREAIIVSILTYFIALVGVYHIAPPDVLLSYTAVYILLIFYCYQFSDRIGRDNSRLAQEANLDSLTGLPNRRSFDDSINRIVTASEEHGTPHCLIMIDIDHFKQVNDNYGHNVGDIALSRLGHLIQKEAGDLGRPFRYGGEEFVLITRQPLTESAALAEALRSCVEEATLLREHKSPLTISAGVAEWDGREEIRSWFKRADNALYQAKTAGRNRVCLSDEPPNVSEN